MKRWLPISLVFVVGCPMGRIDDPKPADQNRPPPGTEPPKPLPVCDGPAEPVVAPLMRLGKHEYEATLRALVGDVVVDDVSSVLAAVPEDHAEDESQFARTDQRISPQHIDAYYRVADAIAQSIVGDADRRAALAGECARGGADDTCLRAFAEAFLRRAFRAEPTAEQIDRAMGAAEGFTGDDRLHAVLFTILMAPEVLYRFENRGSVDAEGVITLTPHELATRLAYHFWQAPPDDALLAAAASGALATDAGYQEQVDRMFEDARTDETILAFFLEWLRVDRGPFATGPRLDVLRDGMNVDGLEIEMHDEIRDLIGFHLGRGDDWADVLTSRAAVARSPRVANLYGVQPWDGTSEPAELPAGERSGLLTRAGMLYTSDGSTNPFKRGVVLRRSILCDTVAPPPDSLPPDALQPPPTVANATTREQFEAKVVNQPCAGCHVQFSPIGYVLEGYDGLGRFRTEEHLVTSTGVDHGFVAVDTAAVARVDGEDDSLVADAVALSQKIAESPKANECLATQYFRFTYRRPDTPYDRCVIHDLTTRLEDGMSLRDALKSVAFDPSFKTRVED